MQDPVLQSIAWFISFVSASRPESLEDPEIGKLKHSFRVSDICKNIAETESCFDHEGVQLAQIIGLLHDIGRFPQYRDYGTFLDNESMDHGELGVEAITDTLPEDLLTTQQKRILFPCVYHHNDRDFPKWMTGETRAFTHLIRDADKLDILNQYVLGKDNDPNQVTSDLMEITPKVHDEFMTTRRVSYSNIRTTKDKDVMRLSWGFEIYFHHAKSLFGKNYLPVILDSLSGVREFDNYLTLIKS